MSYQQIPKQVVWAAELGGVEWLSINDKPWWHLIGSRTTMYRSWRGGEHWHKIVAPGETECVQPEIARALRQLYEASRPKP